MLNKGRLTVLLPIIYIVLFYGWCFFFKGDEWLRTLGAIVFPMIGYLVCYLWIMQTWKISLGEKKNFWLLLGLGMLSNISANLLWLYTFLSKGVTFFSNFSILLWFVAYVFSLLALIYKTKSISSSIINSIFRFNIIVFLIAAIVLSVHYTIIPIWHLWSHSILQMFLTIFYPITNLAILFVITYLYYLSKYSKERGLVFFLVIAFGIQIIADSIFMYISLTDSYTIGSIYEPLWTISTMFIGYAALFAQKYKPVASSNFQDYNASQEKLFPYGSVLILLILGLESYDWNFNALSIGLLIIFFMIIARHLLVVKKNKTLMSEYEYLAYHDSLTGLKNRACFNEDLTKILKKAKINNSQVGLLLIDLDRFKLVNDTLGHYFGDSLLKKVSERLKLALKDNHWFYRLGGDEFVFILPEKSEKECVGIADIILKQFTRSFDIDHHEITITPSVGISLYPINGKDSEELFKNADTAMYIAKENGSNHFQLYTKEINDIITRKLTLENDLTKAIENKQLLLHYQPIIELKSVLIQGVALATP